MLMLKSTHEKEVEMLKEDIEYLKEELRKTTAKLNDSRKIETMQRGKILKLKQCIEKYTK